PVRQPASRRRSAAPPSDSLSMSTTPRPTSTAPPRRSPRSREADIARVLDSVELAVDDLASAKAFYGRALGWSFNDYGPDYAGIVDPRTPGAEVGGLSPHTPPSRGEGVLALVRTDDA